MTGVETLWGFCRSAGFLFPDLLGLDPSDHWEHGRWSGGAGGAPAAWGCDARLATFRERWRRLTPGHLVPVLWPAGFTPQPSLRPAVPSPEWRVQEKAVMEPPRDLQSPPACLGFLREFVPRWAPPASTSPGSAARPPGPRTHTSTSPLPSAPGSPVNRTWCERMEQRPRLGLSTWPLPACSPRGVWTRNYYSAGSPSAACLSWVLGPSSSSVPSSRGDAPPHCTWP